MADVHPAGSPAIAPPPRRVGAAFLDFVIVYLLMGVVTIASHTTTVEDGVQMVKPTAVAYAIVLVLRVAYDVIGIGRWGRTPGKFVAATRVVAADGGPAGWGRAIARYLVSDAGFLLAWFSPRSWSVTTSWLALAWNLAVYAPIVFDDRRRGLHDRAAGTVVVFEPRG